MSRMTFEERQAEDRRLQLLKALASDPDYEINHYVLLGLLADASYRVSMDKLKADIAWLADVELITAESLPGGMIVARIRDRGLDAANGVIIVPGVRHPLPGEA